MTYDILDSRLSLDLGRANPSISHCSFHFDALVTYNIRDSALSLDLGRANPSISPSPQPGFRFAHEWLVLLAWRASRLQRGSLLLIVCPIFGRRVLAEERRSSVLRTTNDVESIRGGFLARTSWPEDAPSYLIDSRRLPRADLLVGGIAMMFDRFEWLPRADPLVGG